MVSTSTGFRVLDAVGAQLTKDEFTAPEPGHVVHHAGRTVLFSDGAGKAISFDPRQLGNGLPKTSAHTTQHPHHGVAVELAGGELLVTLGTEEERTGIQVLDRSRKEIARNEDCLGVHGEATAKDEAVLIGCENGALLYKDGEVTKEIKIMGEWREPLEWQQPRPTLHVRDHTAYVTDPGAKTLYAIDIESGKVNAKAELPQTPNELTSA